MLKWIFWVAVVVISGGCGNSSNKDELEKFLPLGRKVAFQPTLSEGTYLNSDPNQVYKMEDDHSHALLGQIRLTETRERFDRKGVSNAAINYLAENYDTYKVSPKDLVSSKRHEIEPQRGLVSVNFGRKLDGVKVRDAFVELIFRGNDEIGYQLTEVVNRSFGEIVIENPDSQPADVEGWLKSHVGYKWESSSPVILPLPGKDGYRFILSTEVILSKGNEAFTVTMMNGTSEVLEAYSHRVSSGTLFGQSYDLSYRDGAPRPAPLSFVSYSANNSDYQTDVDGGFSSFFSEEVDIDLSGPRVSVSDSSTDEVVQIKASLQEEMVEIGSSPNEIKALNAYVSVSRINDFVRQSLTVDQVSFLDRPANVVINVDGDCNAFYDTRFNSLNFFTEGSGCADTALLNDVIYHEWGHGLDFVTGREGGISDGAFSEGIGDIVATYFTGVSELARGFFINQRNGIRDVANNARFPDDQGEVHVEGQIIAGAFWDLKTAFQSKYGERRGLHMSSELFFKHLLTSDSYQESYLTVLRLDDDDGDPMTRSPNHCLINKAFADHGLADPEDCTDNELASKPELNQDIKLGVYPGADQRQSLMVALSEEPHGVLGCLGDVFQCLDSNERFDFVLEGLSEKDRVIMIPKGEVGITGHTLITIFVMDDLGGIDSYASFKLSPR